MSLNHPTFFFTALALILGLGAWSLSPIEACQYNYADQFNFLHLPNGKNVLSCLSFLIIGAYGLSSRPRFDLGRDVLVSMALCCAGLVAMSGLLAWYHYEPNLASQFAAHLTMALVVMNASFAVVSAQLPLKGRWWLFVACQLMAIGSTSYEYVYNDRKYLFMSEVFLVLLLLFSLVRVWRLPLAKQLLLSLSALVSSFVLGLFDHEISKLSSYMISGHTLQHLTWALGGLFLLRFLICVKPSEINSPVPVSS